MANTKANYYLKELTDWKNSIDFYKEEINIFSTRLGAVISRNSIPHIAEKVESFQTIVNNWADSFYRLQIEIEQQKIILTTDHTAVDDTLINADSEKRQLLLRHNMLVAEQGWLNSKFDCYDFLAGTLKTK